MKIYSYNELKESKIIFDRKAPPFGIIITLITLALVIALIFIAGISSKTYTVKANGIVSSENKVNVMNSVAGNILRINVCEGEDVNVGDVILEIDSFQIDIQIQQLNGSIAFLSNKIENTYKLINFIDNYNLEDENSLINPFDNSINEEKQYYASAEQFIDYAVMPSEDEEQSSKNQEEIDGLKGQFSNQQYSTIDQYNYELVSKQSQKKAYEDSLNEYTITASAKGVMHFSTPVTIGTVIQAGTLIGNISSNKKEDMYIETVVNAFDRSRLKTGSSVEIAVAGIMQSEFGILKGKVVSIGSDSVQTENGEVFYKIFIKPDTTELKDKKGNTVTICNGMLAESRINYDETTWLKWAVEQIGVKFR